MSKIELNRYNSLSLKNSIEKRYGVKGKIHFKMVEDINVGEIVVLPDPLSNVVFESKKWEISGNYCVFKCIENNKGDSVILQPAEDMLSRDNSSMNNSNWNIKLINMIELVMTIA